VHKSFVIDWHRSIERSSERRSKVLERLEEQSSAGSRTYEGGVAVVSVLHVKFDGLGISDGSAVESSAVESVFWLAPS
jgi:hypothetical protein